MDVDEDNIDEENVDKDNDDEDNVDEDNVDEDNVDEDNDDEQPRRVIPVTPGSGHFAWGTPYSAAATWAAWATPRYTMSYMS